MKHLKHFFPFQANAQWRAIVSSGAFKSAGDLISFVGLDKPPVAPHTENPHGHNRSSIVFCVNLLLGAIQSGNPVCRNPAAPHVVPRLPDLLSLIRIFNELFTCEAQNLIHENYKGCLGMLETEKSNLLGLIGHAAADLGEAQVVQSPLERMQRFLFGLHESCYHMIGSMGPSLGRDLYTLPDIGLAIINSVLACLQVRWVVVGGYRVLMWFVLVYTGLQDETYYKSVFEAVYIFVPYTILRGGTSADHCSYRSFE